MSGECCYLCTDCNCSFSSLDELELHIRDHAAKKSQLEPQSSVEDHDMSELDQHSPSSSELTGPVSPDEEMMDSVDMDGDSFTELDLMPGYQCRFCPTRFDDRSQLNIHYTHTHRDKPQYECEVCRTVFAVKRELSTHMRIHSGETPHKCTQCGKEFGTRQLLKKHWMWHTGERSHVCPHCNKAFFQKGHLTQHLMIHSGGRPHQCKLCQKTFIFKFDLNRHMKIHAERGFCCNLCGRSFIRQVSLDDHMLKCKGKSSPTSRSSTPPMKMELQSPSLFPMMSPNMINFNQEQMAKMAQTLFAQQQQRALASLLASQQQQQAAAAAAAQQAVQTPPQAPQPLASPLFCVLCSKHFPNQPSFTVHMYLTHIQNQETRLHENVQQQNEESQVKQESAPRPSVFTPVNPIKTEHEEEHVNVHSETATNSSSCASSPQKSFSEHSPSVLEDTVSPTYVSSPDPKDCQQKTCGDCERHLGRSHELEAALLAKGNELEKYKEMMKMVVSTAGQLLNQCSADNVFIAHTKNIFTQLQNTLCTSE